LCRSSSSSIPVIRALQGQAQEKPRVTRAQLTRPVRSPAGRRSFISGILDYQAGTVTPAPGPSAHQLTALAQANALIIVSEEITVRAEGTTVELLELPS
jgi:molybdopterin molybdotransferase